MLEIVGIVELSVWIDQLSNLQILDLADNYNLESLQDIFGYLVQ